MAEVYLGEQLSLGRKVALKVMKRDVSKHPSMMERFRREARLLSSVDHPAVVRVIDFESSGDGNVLVLEWADGVTLDALLKTGPLSPERAIPILAQLAAGLSAIHQKGIIHRDLKPQNVVISTTPRGEQARLLDFGIARLFDLREEPRRPSLDAVPVPATDPMVSMPGQVVGTPAFVAPEQATAQPLDSRTDVYAFGVLAYRVLSGVFPFAGPTSRDFLLQHLSVPPRPLLDAAPHLAGHPWLVSLVMSCLSKKMEGRPRDGAALSEVLAAHLTGALPFDSGEASQSSISRASSSQAGLDRYITRAKLAAVTARTRAASGGSATVALFRKSFDAIRPEWKRSVAVVLVLLGLSPTVFAMFPEPPIDKATRLALSGQNETALAQVDELLKKNPSDAPVLLSLRFALLHRLERHAEERELLGASPYQILYGAHPLAIAALADDFGQAEHDRELLQALTLAPRPRFAPELTRLANGPHSGSQWGALRYLDLSNEGTGVDRVARYCDALKAPDCSIRGKAAVRLGELADARALEALRELSETPKLETSGERLNCGQDEAAESVRQLKKGALPTAAPGGGE